MPDMTMCMNDKCTLATTCKRSQKSGTVLTPMQQSVAFFSQDFAGNCDHYKQVTNWRVK